MQNPEKEKFILQAVTKINELQQRIEKARKNNQNMKEIMLEVQQEIQSIKDEADDVFQAKSNDMDPKELESFLQNPSNFSKEDWGILEEIKGATKSCKKEIIKAGEKDAVNDLIGKTHNKSPKKRKKRWGSKKYV